MMPDQLILYREMSRADQAGVVTDIIHRHVWNGSTQGELVLNYANKEVLQKISRLTIRIHEVLLNATEDDIRFLLSPMDDPNDTATNDVEADSTPASRGE